MHSSAIASYELIASLHHLPLFEALPASLIPANLNIRFVDFGIDGSMLRAFTNRHLLNGATILEMRALADFCKQNPSPDGGDFMENTHRKWLLEFGTGKKFNTIAGWSDVYKNYHHFFKSAVPEIPFNRSTAKSMLILPTARIAKRNIPNKVINSIGATHKELSVKIAYYKHSESGGLVYTNFSELINLISSADFIYGADSLPIHLSYLLQKPHAIVYPSGVSQQFFTPFALDNAQYFNFNQFN